MKFKKFFALALSAVMAVSVLSACGGAGAGSVVSNDGGAVSSKNVNTALENVGASDVKVISSTELNGVLENAGKELQAGKTADEVAGDIVRTQKWTVIANLGEALENLGTGKVELHFGNVKIVKAEQLAAGLDSHDFFNSLDFTKDNNDEIARLDALNSTAAVAAAMTLQLDGYVKGGKFVAAGRLDNINVTYTVSAVAVEGTNGEYYIIAVDAVAKN